MENKYASGKIYANAKIYAIKNKCTRDIYVGSTCRSLKQRFNEHLSAYKHGDSLLHELMRKYGRENFYIVLIREYPCNSGRELLIEESRHIIQIGTLNKKPPVDIMELDPFTKYLNSLD